MKCSYKIQEEMCFCLSVSLDIADVSKQREVECKASVDSFRKVGGKIKRDIWPVHWNTSPLLPLEGLYEIMGRLQPFKLLYPLYLSQKIDWWGSPNRTWPF